MLVKVNTSLAGADFSFRFGEEVEQELFAASVGNGWESLCDPVDASETTQDAPAIEPVIETADAPPDGETTSKRGRRK